MSSNILAGERRWASARRTGMTVLGKVAVPKPLNLPSQKLENHGMDPNVEIVPKGSIGWGNRPSSSASNPWGSSSVSSTVDGGRPSSSGSRPSTAGSETTHDHGGNAWVLGSRPSSASGISASNQTSLTSLRPHSAETRPSSSQMSRFAEQHTDNVVAHHPVVSSEQAGLASSSDKERFSLTTGDFPTLNSVADSSLRSSDPRDQGSNSRPNSASGGVTKKDNSDISQTDIQNGTVNAWKRDGHRNNDEMHPSMDSWHGEPPRYHNANVPPPHFGGWRGPSMNHPGVWYQGLPPGPPPYGGFPVEPPPFSFYCPRGPPSGLPNSQPVPLTRPGAPMGHPKNGEIYRPPMPDAFVRPGMQFRPGFYPMPFEGYYGPPPMGYCNPNELEVPFKGPPTYNRYPARDNDPIPFNDFTATHNRTGKNSTGVKRFSEKAERNHFNDVPEHVILKHNDADLNYPNPKKRNQPGIISRTKEWGADYDNEDDMYSDARGGTDSLTIRSGPYGSGDNVMVDNIQLKKIETDLDGGPTLLQKIEGLNEKVRTSDGRNEGLHSSKWAEQKGTGAAIIGEITVPLVDTKSHVTAAPRQGYGAVRGKTTDYNKQNFNGPDDANGRQKKLDHENKINTTVAVTENLQEDREVVDVTDTHTQRLKMRELVKQRALQLQKEEEERTKEQKAKALAKLEELNRRNTMIHKDENVKTHYESKRTSEWGDEEEEEPKLPSEPPKTTIVLDTKEEVLTDSGYKQNVHAIEHAVQTEIGGVAQRDVGSGSDSKTADIIHVAVESSLSQQRRRSNKNTKNKQNNKPDDFPSTGAVETKPPVVSINGDGPQGSMNHHHQKPQKSSRFARNQPTTRFSDKYHGNDYVVWAPVQSQSKTEPTTTETAPKGVEETAISAKNDDDQVPNNMKSKRAEMERYVPKPVAKELAQQSITLSDEVTEKIEPEDRPSTESRVEDLKQTKAVGGGWKHRGPSSFKPNSRNQQSSYTKTEEQNSFKDPNTSDDFGASGIISVESQGRRYQENTTSRGKRHILKGEERSMRNDREHEKNSTSQKPDKTHIQDPKMNNPTGKSSSSKENRGFEDRPSSSHWQPKSSSTQNVVGGGIQSLPEEHVSHTIKPISSVPKGGNSPLVEGTVSQEGQRREKKVPYLSKGSHSHVPTEDESAFGGCDESQTKQQHFSSDYRRGGRYQNARAGTNREFHNDLNHERHGQNIHYEFKPIPGKEKKFENSEDGSHNVGPRYKERGGQHSRRGRGQFHGQHSSSNNMQVGF